MRRRLLLAILLPGLAVTVLATPTPGFAGGWAEVGDAADLPPGQVTNGLGSLDFITGLIDTSLDKDMYRIEITDPLNFSATVIAGGSLTDAQLFLFDAAGVAVYGNDDDGDTLPTLPAGHASGPSAAGDYFLAISGPDNDPTSGALEMFTDNVPGVQTPLLGGAIVNGWTPTFSAFGGTYQIDLVGASFATSTNVPAIPAWVTAALVAGLGGVALWMLPRRRAARPRRGSPRGTG